MKRLLRIPRSLSSISPTHTTPRRGVHLPGWKNKVATKDVRTREQRDADRKLRQLEKLPPVEALPDFQYPYEKTLLTDYMFQYPLYENELDTPHLFHLTPPPNFFLYWNVTDFDRTAYPAVPEEDHRLLQPSLQSPAWMAHRTRALRYLRKHEILPAFLPRVPFTTNLSVVFPGSYATRSRVPPEQRQAAAAAGSSSAVREMTKRNFWFTAHCGNYIELTDVQLAPTIFIVPSEEDQQLAKDGTPCYYTLLMVSPDYPYRLPPAEDRSASRGFFIHHMVGNLTATTSAAMAGQEPWRGEVIVPYTPPLPTEDAGTTRHVCLLYRQQQKVDFTGHAKDAEDWESKHFPLALRSNFRLHSDSDRNSNALGDLSALESVLLDDPLTATFFQTKWDIQVQEYYEKVGHPEPAAPIDEHVEALLEFHSSKPEENRVRSRHRPDGSTNIGDDPQFWGQQEQTRVMNGSMQSMWSKRTALGRNGIPITYPH